MTNRVSTVNNLTSVLRQIPNFLERVEYISSQDATSINTTELLIRRLFDYANIVTILLLRCDGEPARLLTLILDSMMSAINSLRNYIDQLNEQQGSSSEINSSTCLQVDSNGLAGRPRIIYTRDLLESVVSDNRFRSLREISEEMGVSVRTLYRWRQESNLPIGSDRYTDMEDHDIDSIVREILSMNPNAGETMIRGGFAARGIKIQILCVRQSILRVDPLSRALRRRIGITRRQYNVPGPNALWHLDGNHKLIRWRFVIHGCIDGFSRYIIYIGCENNNRATTVLNLFQDGLNRCGVPSRIRPDMGVENGEVIRLMLDIRGLNRGSAIIGRSVHNQRIERLWLDVRYQVTEYYRQIFFFMEDHNILDTNSELQLFVLHYVYMPRITRSLQNFQESYNHHPMRTLNGASPYQVWARGPWHESEPQSFDNASYGIDEDIYNYEDRSENNVHVVDIQYDDVGNILAGLDPLAEDYNHGIHLFTDVCNLLQQM